MSVGNDHITTHALVDLAYKPK